jgi:molybdate transport system ATP-binding protein
MSVFQVIASGFYDSIGLFRPLNEDQVQAVEQWAEALGLLHLLNRPFLNTSQGQQRLSLIARALVKQPRILILDEPLHGLDPGNRKKVLGYLQEISRQRQGQITMFYISHSSEEQEWKPPFITNSLSLDIPQYH